MFLLLPDVANRKSKGFLGDDKTVPNPCPFFWQIFSKVIFLASFTFCRNPAFNILKIYEKGDLPFLSCGEISSTF